MGVGDLHISVTTIILGRPFLQIAWTKIGAHADTLTKDFGDNLVQFNVL